MVHGFNFDFDDSISDILGVSDDSPAASVSQPEFQSGATNLLGMVSQINDLVTLGHRVLHLAVRCTSKALVGLVRTKIDPQGNGRREIAAEVTVLR